MDADGPDLMGVCSAVVHSTDVHLTVVDPIIGVPVARATHIPLTLTSPSASICEICGSPVRNSLHYTISTRKRPRDHWRRCGDPPVRPTITCFTGADEPYEKLKRALRAEIDEAAWSSLYATRSRPFDAPKTGKVAVKVINHYGDEVLKVFEVGRAG
jgi:hypothetical protein